MTHKSGGQDKAVRFISPEDPGLITAQANGKKSCKKTTPDFKGAKKQKVKKSPSKNLRKRVRNPWNYTNFGRILLGERTGELEFHRIEPLSLHRKDQPAISR
jgi:hypothetical protein